MLIKEYRINTEIFEKIMAHAEGRIVSGPIDFKSIDFIPGYVYYNGHDILMRDCAFRAVAKVQLDETEKFNYTSLNRLCYLRVDDLVDRVTVDISGRHAYLYFLKLLKKYYTEAQIQECLNAHEAEFEEEKAQMHFNAYLGKEDVIHLIHGCSYYDINSAHGDALREIFPKAAKDIEKLYKKRKEHPEYKKVLNYFVGYLCCVNHRKTYNWIVQRTTVKVKAAIEATYGDDSMLLYINTDGFIIQNSNKFDASKALGEFKLEYEGDIYYYSNRNNKSPYLIFQYGNEMKGTAPKMVRENFDFKNGIVAYYRRVPKKLEDGTIYYVTEDITKEKREVKCHG